MTQKEKLLLIEETMDLEEGTLKPSDILADFEEWDSLAALSFIAMLGSKFHKTIHTNEIKKLKSVEDALGWME